MCVQHSVRVRVLACASGRLEEVEEVGAVLLRQAHHQPRVDEGELRRARCTRRTRARRLWSGLRRLSSGAAARLLTLVQLAHGERVEPCERRRALHATAAAAAAAADAGFLAV